MKSHYLANKLLDLRYGGAGWTPPPTVYLARIVAPAWAAAAVIALNSYVYEAGRIFKATTGGTTGGGAPAWPNVDGGTVADGSVVWTEQTIALRAGLPSALECSSAAYARQAITNNATNFPNAVNGGKGLALPVAFATETNPAGRTVGFALFDQLTGGNLLDIAFSQTPKDFVAFDKCDVPANSLTFTET
ncbi:MAG: hypothetical protein SFV32_12800 [Opitutaceae bacterium]|nr:hypothetical protein [Opitutaceae bacterium]